jgi:hypothetical protein
MPFKYNDGGSLDLYFQNKSPGQNKEANWLPAPKGTFNLTMRVYALKPGVDLGISRCSPASLGGVTPFGGRIRTHR